MIALVIMQLYVVSAVTLLFTLRKLIAAEKIRYVDDGKRLSKEEAPTVSVCIPARNETNAMTECLELLLASSYPKLEIIVLDDNSSDNTSHLIRAFAHAGVRFVQGDELPEGWIGKNYSLQTMLKQASGKYVLFMDVDIRVERDSISKLVAKAQSADCDMVSVIPQRKDVWRASVWFGTLRYFWEIVLGSKKTPGASSSVWLIKRSYFNSNESVDFPHLKSSLQPELEISKNISKSGNYKMLTSTTDLGITYEKKWLSQVETSRRILLPRLGASLKNTIVGIGLAATVVLPQIIAIFALMRGSYLELFGAAIIGLMAAVGFVLYCRIIWTRRWWLAWLIVPIIAWQEIIVVISSAIGYRRGTISWKGRPITRSGAKN